MAIVIVEVFHDPGGPSNEFWMGIADFNDRRIKWRNVVTGETTEYPTVMWSKRIWPSL